MSLKVKFVSLLFILSSLFACENNSAPAENKTKEEPSPKAIYPPDTSLYNKIDDFFKKKFKLRAFNGNVLVAKDGEILYRESMGYRDVKKKQDLSIESVFELASVSKPLTATAIMLLAQKEKLSLNDSVQSFLPDFPYKDITIEHLLCHRGGLTNYMYFSDKYWDNRDAFITNKDVIKLMEEKVPKVYYLPNRRYNYSNTGYCILASIVEKASRKSFKKFLKEEVFSPLEMNNTFVYDTTLNKTDSLIYTYGHEKNNRKSRASYLNGVVGDKGIYSTVDDMFKFDQALFGGKLLKNKWLELIFKPMHKDLYKWDNYGLGWRLNVKNPKDRIAYHTGWWNGYRSYFIKKIDRDETIIILNNTTRGSFIRLEDLLKLI